jgi:flavin-dependent dehydrogenase
MSEQAEERNYDVLIIGASFAGSGLARQLKLKFPDMSIAVVERKEEFTSWVGESTIDPWVHYAYEELKLSRYLNKNCIMKHGLRFFFDSEEKDLSVTEMSENGRWTYPHIPSFQINRAVFDQDMVDMNRELGIDVFMGTRVFGRGGDDLEEFIEIDGENGHTVHTTEGIFNCRYLVDAGGRGSLLARRFDLVEKDPRHPCGSYWGRVKGMRTLDDFDDEEYVARVKGWPRHPSTNHFMYRDYWVWLIPITDTETSVGVVFNRDRRPLKMKSGEDLLGFMREHQWGREVFPEETEILDFEGLKDIPRGAKKHFSTDRWFLTGMSGTFVDPLFSTSCSFIAKSNCLITEMIQADLDGDQDRFHNLAENGSAELRLAYEDQIESFNFDRLASFDAWVGWRNAKQQAFYITGVNNLVHGRRFSTEMAAQSAPIPFDKRLREAMTSVSRCINAATDEFVAFLDDHNAYYDLNRGEFHEGAESLLIRDYWYKDLDFNFERERVEEAYEATIRHFVMRMLTILRIPWNEEAFVANYNRDWWDRQPLSDLVDAIATAGPGEKRFSECGWNLKGPCNPYDSSWTPGVGQEPPSAEEAEAAQAERPKRKSA